MRKASPVRKTNVARAVAGAIAGGMKPGQFEVRVRPDGEVLILPAAAGVLNEDDEMERRFRQMIDHE